MKYFLPSVIIFSDLIISFSILGKSLSARIYILSVCILIILNRPKFQIRHGFILTLLSPIYFYVL